MDRAFICCRYILVFSALILGISGAVMSILSGYFIYQLHEYAPFTPDNVCGSPATLLAMGIITCVFGWLAFQFLNFSNRGQVIIFVVVLTIIIFTEVGVGIWALVRHEQIDIMPSTKLKKSFDLAVTDEKLTWDHAQSQLHCCGINALTDYHDQNSIPWSCCNMTNVANDNSIEGVCTTMYKRGCHQVVINRTRSIQLHVFLLALCSVLLQISFVVCACCYTKIYKKKMERKAQMELAKRTREQDTNDVLLTHRWKLDKPDGS